MNQTRSYRPAAACSTPLRCSNEVLRIHPVRVVAAHRRRDRVRLAAELGGEGRARDGGDAAAGGGVVGEGDVPGALVAFVPDGPEGGVDFGCKRSGQ